ncbi:hypothetical protein K505DRAFT_84636 [Melanomma pulvis-pyrius CBS 109.77]|uniref:Uncharacterized protein n=1 Tax=Melanomma pulvis-pyrius CBS 109.77 TaxID=1314802 RepID=A0A6A6X1M6_9PLEO|nr:hypothetical protein K505DRAFT_84636 [Melanomma pulvis-pyrius CBS 109.77]
MDGGGNDSTLEPAFYGLGIIPTVEYSFFPIYETNRLIKKMNARPKSAGPKNTKNGKMEGIGYGREWTASLLGRRMREDFDDGEPSCSERTAARFKRRR